MNQIQKSLVALPQLKSCAVNSLVLKTGFGVALFVVCSLVVSQSAIAQNQFEPQNSQTDFGQLTPPNSMPSVYQNPSPNLNASRIPSTAGNSFNAPASGVSFPDSVAPFDTGIRTANFAMPTPDAATESGSFEEKIDGAAETFSKWKDIAGEKTTGWLEGLKQEGGWMAKIQSMLGSSDISKMLGSLALVLGIYFAFVWLMRKIYPNGNGGLPQEVIEVMGQVPFGPRRNLQLVRLGSKMLLLMNSAEGTQPIGEITDPAEVDYLASLCPSKGRGRSRSTASLQQAATQALPPRLTNAGASAAQAAGIGNVASTNLNDVIRILQQAAKPGGTVFEA